MSHYKKSNGYSHKSHVVVPPQLSRFLPGEVREIDKCWERYKSGELTFEQAWQERLKKVPKFSEVKRHV